MPSMSTDRATTRPTGPHLLHAQLEVLRLVAAGKTTREAAAALGISPSAAWLHCFTARHRWGIGSNEELIEAARRDGLI